MAAVTHLVALVACVLPFCGVFCEDASQVPAVDAAIDEIFTNLVEEAGRDFRFSHRLRNCSPGEKHEPGQCRRYLKNEPDEARELFPFLAKDEEAMRLWRAHFQRHVKESLGDIDQFVGVEAPLEVPGLEPIAESEFWASRPAVSAGALAYLKLKMEQLKMLAVASGADEKGAVTWEAEVSPRFKYHSMKDAAVFMGTYLTDYANPDKPSVPLGEPLPAKVFANMEPVEAESFDARESFPECKGIIGRVRDQGNCGSCWALAATESLNDRFCIKNRGKSLELLSIQHTVSCCDALHCLSFGCMGGQPRMAWRWFGRDGVVTGGDYDELNTGKSCWPYEMPFCQHHTDGPYPPCGGPVAETPKCRKTCEEGYQKNIKPFEQDKHFAATSYSVRGRDQIKRELMENGPLTGAFLVYEDFLMYKSGVYHHIAGNPIGGHAVKFIGFGKEDAKDYWLAVNSWNVYWGDKGTFKIQMGEGGVDNEFCGGDAKTAAESVFRKQAGQDL